MKVEQIGVGNLDGLRRMKAVAVTDVLELYPADRYLIPAEKDFLHKVIMPPGCMLLRELADWLEIKFRPGNGTLFHKRLEDDRVDNLVTLTISGDFPEMAVAERRLKSAKWLLVTEDLNGAVKLVGTREQPLVALASYNSTGRSWTVEWTGVTDMLPFYLPGYSQADLEGDGVSFDAGFDFGFDS